MIKYILILSTIMLTTKGGLASTSKIHTTPDYSNLSQMEQLKKLGFTFTDDLINDFLKEFQNNWSTEERQCIKVLDDNMSFMITDLPQNINAKYTDGLGVWLDNQTVNNKELRVILIKGILEAQQKDLNQNK
jgi:hypothetical protein